LDFSDAFGRAEAGDAYAQAVLSIYYDLGYKTAADPRKAVEYAMKSAEQGSPLGIYRLGVMRAEGKYIGKDEAQGAQLKQKAFAGLDKMYGDPYALTALGVMLHRGEGGRAPDWAEAARLYKLAADQGYAPAQLNLSACYLSGKGVPQSESLGMKYWQDAYNQNYPLALKGPPR
jgi:TPR repeat protein